MSTLVQQVQLAIEKHALLPAGATVLVGVSGGADSVALLHILAELAGQGQLSLAVAHLNHGIRTEAAEDRKFVEALCEELGVPFRSAEVDVPALSTAHGISLEMAARDARYAFFASTAAELGAAAVATAHTQDDQAETVLLKLCRGAGGSGLRGVARCTTIQGLQVIRPLLDVSRSTIEGFLRENGHTWREDATNSDTRIKRNFVRHEVIPLLEQGLNPRVKEALSRAAGIIAEDETALDQLTELALAEAQNEEGALQTNSLADLAPSVRRRALQAWLIRMGVAVADLSFETVERLSVMAKSSSGSQSLALAGGHAVTREYDLLRFVEVEDDTVSIPEVLVSVPGETVLPSVGLSITASLVTGFERKPTGPIGRIPSEAFIRWDGDAPPPLMVRSWRAGDRIQPTGSEDSRKLQDLFVDAKIPRGRRSTIPVFTCHDEIVWVPGYRIARNWAVLHPKQRSLLLRVTLV